MNLDQIRAYCLSLHGTEEDIKWGNDLCFTIGKKMYCATGADGLGGIAFKCSEEDFELLLERDGIIPAPYLARNKWVQVEKRAALSKQEWEHFLKQSYELVVAKLPKKLRVELGKQM